MEVGVISPILIDPEYTGFRQRPSISQACDEIRVRKMQFVANGPNIPDALLQAHEEGRVVFFCGAGISYPAGLPGFNGLVDKIYRILGTKQEPIEQNAYKSGQFDVTLDLLERRLPGQRFAVRRALATALQPKLRRKGATETHAALMQLARNRNGDLRLVTTNFDRLFEKVIKRTKQPISSYAAPMLPIPKDSRWNGLVYLHGLLPENQDASALRRLVLTSGDFGLAYLTERWAARFVSELFRNYVVCFVGYSINDPVLRYMMDALAADRRLGEATPQAYALGHFKRGHEGSKTTEWKAKGVTPILYEMGSAKRDHLALHSTLKAWAETYRDGTLGKERIVVSYALAQPSASTRQDNFVGRMLWALSDPSGLPAKRFAEFNPVPTLAWLETISEYRYRHGDLARFGVSPRAEMDDKLCFSLIHRPAPYIHAPWMSLVSQVPADSRWDDVMSKLAGWLVRHLNDPALIIWLAQRGGQLHYRFRGWIEKTLDDFARLEREGEADQLEEIRANAPNAIPDPLMQTLWRLLLTSRVKSPRRDKNLYSWKKRLKRDGLTTTLHLELRELLAPKVLLKEPIRWHEEDHEDDAPQRLKKLVDWELVLTADRVHSSLRDLDDQHWRQALWLLLDDFQQLLRDALNLFRELGGDSVHSDRSFLDLPSITPHRQNRYFRDWVVLIELLRDSWLETRERDPERATKIAQGWSHLPYPTFKRLALFAASQDNCISPDEWVAWLTSEDGWCLWSNITQRETMRLLVLQGANLSPEAEARLEETILMGPPRALYPDDIEPDHWRLQVERSVWLVLAKLREGGVKLGVVAKQRFDELSAANPVWELASNERDESDFEDFYHIDIAPRKRRDLVAWLKQQPRIQGPLYEDTWRETCRTRFFHSFLALCDLAQEQLWPARRWREALQVWSEEGKALRSWRFAAPLVQTIPSDVLQEIAHSVSWWLETVSKFVDRHEAVFLGLCRRILALPYQDGEDTDRPVSRAINHPVGHVTEAVLNLWLKRTPNDNDALPLDIEMIFTELCDVGKGQFRHGRVLLASRLIVLFRVDQSWTKTHLLPLFTWTTNATEAKAAWEGFLWSPRLYHPLMVEIKSQFLETAHHYTELGEHSRQFAAFLAYAALDRVDGYTAQEFQGSLEALPQEGLEEAGEALWQALEGAGDQREEYWKNRILPFWQQVWPKSLELASNNISESLARLSIAARGEFPGALSTVQGWLQPIEAPDHVVHLLHEGDLARRFPEDALSLLSAILDNQPWAPLDLGKCLDAISQARPQLLDDPGYRRLREYSRRHGV